MRSLKIHAPYSLYKKSTKSGLFWYVRFWDADTERYNIVRSTGIKAEGKRERWREADDAAKAILEEIKQKPAVLKHFHVSSPQLIDKSFLSSEVLPLHENTVYEENQSQPQCVKDILLVQYLKDFWTSDSEYAKYKRDVKKKPLSSYYIQMNHDDVTRHIASFPGFQTVKLGDLTLKLLKEWMIWMASKKVVHKKKDGSDIISGKISGRRINNIVQGMRVAVRWAVDNEDLEKDPFKRLDEAAEDTKEKGILTNEEINNLINSPVNDPYSRLAVLLAARCGMRRGEVRGLKWGDIKDGIITIQNNYVNADGLKSPKIKGGTIVKNSCPIPLPADVEAILTVEPLAKLYKQI